MATLTIPAQKPKRRLTPTCIRICAHCDDEIDTAQGIVSIRAASYHPYCVQCYKCKKQVDGSNIDEEGRMVCLECTRQSEKGKVRGVRLSVTSNSSSESQSIYATEGVTCNSKLNEFELGFLNGHNKYRSRHKVPELQWSEKLASKARKWAIHLIAQNRNKDSTLLGGVQQDPTTSVGQTCCTIPAVTKPTRTDMANRVCDQWYETGDNFVVGTTLATKESASFTQMVWRSSQRVGACLMWYGQVGIIVAYYWPPGNLEQEFSANVTKVLRTPVPTRRKIVVE